MDSEREWTHYQHMVFHDTKDEKVYYAYYGWHVKGSRLREVKCLGHEVDEWGYEDAKR